MAQRTLVLLGGGLDSTTLLVWLRKAGGDCAAIFFDYGQIAVNEEWNSVAYFCAKYNVSLRLFELPLNEITSSRIMQPSVHTLIVKEAEITDKVEARNVIFVMLAGIYAQTVGCDAIALGCHAQPEDHPFKDASPPALATMQGVLNTAYSKPIKLRFPFITMTKAEIVEHGVGLDPEILTKTHTCYTNILGGCGECSHCRQKAEIIANFAREAEPDVNDWSC
jgi:7-cyano-7-deazaguanine synthase